MDNSLIIYIKQELAVAQHTAAIGGVKRGWKQTAAIRVVKQIWKQTAIIGGVKRVKSDIRSLIFGDSFTFEYFYFVIKYHFKLQSPNYKTIEVQYQLGFRIIGFRVCSRHRRICCKTGLFCNNRPEGKSI